MAFRVFDSRTDIQNLIIHPDIRARFLQMEPGEENVPHSHDLGAEIFLILEGQAEFVIEGHTEVLGPGQLCFADRDEIHTVRCVGDSTMTMYLSVTPHIDPTHTMWEDSGIKAPPRYGGSTSAERAAMDAQTSPPRIADLTAAHTSAADEAAQAAQAAAEAQRTGAAALEQALADGDQAAAEAVVDDMWSALYRSFSANRELAAAWNALAPRVGRQ
jgi:quercetin dioxygenase-like cupin family protein